MNTQLQKPEGRHCEVVPGSGSHYVLVDGVQWSRHNTLAVAEGVRGGIVELWATYYEQAAGKIFGD